MLDDLLRLQSGVITKSQARRAGLSDGAIRRHVGADRWSPLFPGVYWTFSGPPPREALLWAVLLRAGRGAALSHHTAAELSGLIDTPGRRIHVTIPANRRIAAIPGVIVHRSGRVAAATMPGPTLRRTRIEDTVLDLTDLAGDIETAVGWITTACARRLTTPRRLAEAMARRKQVRRRPLLAEVLDDSAAGVHSVLERRYLRDVERGHGLPRGRRQTRHAGAGVRFRDVEYAAFDIIVELDGRAYHPAEHRRRDRLRDNESAAQGCRTLRYGWTDVAAPCSTAVQVARALRAGGWTGQPRRCTRPGCAVLRSTRRRTP
ncbi:type IV toxin-antitoxin system AbiEi family antitoxin domain-containing protein [Dactylosporangium sp. NPDC051484]|uniref:type IV toxin-antitoxin system AbiEi family antitoxin domain-containing protein n=1 Tax=Dactylosporangium sp. NPDC051484 TaxID=3154942 RepID=UPI00344FE557